MEACAASCDIFRLMCQKVSALSSGVYVIFGMRQITVLPEISIEEYVINLYVFGVSCCNVFFSQFLKLILNTFILQICTFCSGLSKGFTDTEDQILILCLHGEVVYAVRSPVDLKHAKPLYSMVEN